MGKEVCCFPFGTGGLSPLPKDGGRGVLLYSPHINKIHFEKKIKKFFKKKFQKKNFQKIFQKKIKKFQYLKKSLKHFYLLF